MQAGDAVFDEAGNFQVLWTKEEGPQKPASETYDEPADPKGGKDFGEEAYSSEMSCSGGGEGGDEGEADPEDKTAQDLDRPPFLPDRIEQILDEHVGGMACKLAHDEMAW